MIDLSNEIIKNKIDYEKIKEKKSFFHLNDNQDCFINVIIGCRGRQEFLKPLTDSFISAIDNYKEQKICLNILEHNTFPQHLKFCKNNNINYIWTEGNVSEQYSRSFAYNFGVKFSNKAKYYLLHDLDILVKKNFFYELIENLKNFKCVQSYGGKRVLYMNNELTDKVIKKILDYNSFNEKYLGVSLPMFNGKPALGSKGGSILIEKELFDEVGGFDPEIFWGYAAEDQFFWEKVLQVSEIGYADKPLIDMFHMWHPPSHASNPDLMKMESFWIAFKNMTKEDKLKIIELKKKLYE